MIKYNIRNDFTFLDFPSFFRGVARSVDIFGILNNDKKLHLYDYAPNLTEQVWKRVGYSISEAISDYEQTESTTKTE